MQRAMLDAPIVATDDWYCSADVVDHSAMASSMEWTELLAAHAAAANGGPAVARPHCFTKSKSFFTSQHRDS